MSADPDVVEAYLGAEDDRRRAMTDALVVEDLDVAYGPVEAVQGIACACSGASWWR